MDDNELSDFETAMNDMDWDHPIPGKERKQPVKTGGESSERGDDDEDSVQVVHDSQTINEPAQKAPSKRNPPKPPLSKVIRRSTMSELVKIPKIKTDVVEWAEFLKRGARELPEKFFEEWAVSTAM